VNASISATTIRVSDVPGGQSRFSFAPLNLRSIG
jgi:hypothetical protein